MHVVGAQHLVLFGRGDEVADEARPVVRPVLLQDLHEAVRRGAGWTGRAGQGRSDVDVVQVCTQ